MDKLLWAIIPACITFGPLFMTRIAGSHLVGEGVSMLSIGLVGIFRIIHKQQKMIHALEERLGK